MRLLPLALLAGCQDYNLEAKDSDPEGIVDTAEDSGGDTTVDDDDLCPALAADAEAVPPNDACDYSIGGFEPVVKWAVTGEFSTSLPVVGDMDGDGLPEVAIVMGQGLMQGRIKVYHGDGRRFWENNADNIGYGSAPALADLDEDGLPELYVVKEYTSGLWSSGDYTVIAFAWDGEQLWESEHFVAREMDYATGIAASDMDHDGAGELVVGQVILNADGSTRAVSEYPSRGCPTDAGVDWLPREGGFPAVVDLDLDGVEEVVTGNTIFGPDGETLWHDTDNLDGSVAIANLDEDPEGEFVVAWGNTLRAHDTDGSILWGPIENPTANIFPVPTVGDVDADGWPEIVVAGGNRLWVVKRDGSMLWTYDITDKTGATGASIFDFDADGIPEVVYVDEVEMLAFNGADGTVKFHSTDHGSVTMYDYPVVADVDADGHADILVANESNTGGLVVYEDAENSWAPVRSVWNQHAYTITNINDDLTLPTTATPNFTVYNSYHSALSAPPGEALSAELEAEILDVCELDCDGGEVSVLVRARNTGSSDVDAGLVLALYAMTDSGNRLLTTTTLDAAVAAEMSSVGVELTVNADDVRDASALWLVVDDDGTGTGHVAECLETNNGFSWEGPFCE